MSSGSWWVDEFCWYTQVILESGSLFFRMTDPTREGPKKVEKLANSIDCLREGEAIETHAKVSRKKPTYTSLNRRTWLFGCLLNCLFACWRFCCTNPAGNFSMPSNKGWKRTRWNYLLGLRTKRFNILPDLRRQISAKTCPRARSSRRAFKSI